MQGFEVKFKIYADSQEEADNISSEFKGFVESLRLKGIAVSASKLKDLFILWNTNSFIRNKVTNFFI